MIKRGVQALLKQFGYRLAPASDSVVPNCGLSNLFPLIKKFGFDPKHIVDVGANHGSWTREAVQYFPRAHYTLVEPQHELRIHSQDLIELATAPEFCRCTFSGLTTAALFCRRRELRASLFEQSRYHCGR